MNALLRLSLAFVTIVLPFSAQALLADSVQPVVSLADAPANAKGVSFDGEVQKIWSVARHKGTTAKVVVVSIHVDTHNADFEEMRIRFDEASGKAEYAWWFSKGNYAISLPKEDLLLKDIPPQRSDVLVTFDRDIPQEATEIAGIRLLALVPQKPPAAAPVGPR